MDKRIRYLQKRLDDLEIVDRVPSETDRVFFGAWITLEDEEGNESTLRIVGVDELDLDKGW
ncbi:MAG: GreA/GreB family elongation factor, partial [Pseudomonadota bacterium]